MNRIVPVPTAKGSASMLLLAVLVFALGSCGGETTSTKTGGGETTSAAGMVSRTVELTPSRDSGVSGTATLTDTQNGVEVKLDMRGFKSSTLSHQAYIHEGATCADDRAGNGAPVKHLLEPLEAKEDGTATSTITVTGATLAQLFSGPPKYINVHREYTGEGPPPEKTSEGLPPGISCADLSTGDNTTDATGGTASGGSTTGG